MKNIKKSKNEEMCGSQQHLHHKTSGHRHVHVREVHTDRMHVRKSWRSGTSTILPGWRATRVGPGQYPQYTRALYGGEAVGSSPSETTEHTCVTSNEPNRNLETV